MKQVKYVIGWIVVLLTLAYAFVMFGEIFNINPKTIISPLTEQIASLEIPFIAQIKNKDNSLKTTIEQILDNNKDNFGVVIKNLKSKDQYTLNEHRIFQSGSLYKLWIMATAYDQIRRGLYSETLVLEQEIPILNEKFQIATEDAERIEGKITLSVANALDQMITVSDNYAALLLSEKVRLSNVAKFLKDHGLNESKVATVGGVPTATPSDIALFFEKLYQGKLTDASYDQKMLDILKSQKLNHKIPLHLPDDTVIAHKTGELEYFTHDGGIVYTPHGDYIIVIMSESQKPKEAEQIIATLSEAVYRYFTDQ